MRRVHRRTPPPVQGPAADNAARPGWTEAVPGSSVRIVDEDAREIGGRGAGRDDGVTASPRLLHGKILAEVGSAAFLPPQRRLGDQPADEQEIARFDAAARDGTHRESAFERQGGGDRTLQAGAAPDDAGAFRHESPKPLDRGAGALRSIDSARPCSHARGPSGAGARESPRTARPDRAPNTRPSRRELLASRLAPCTPVHATSPAAYSPGTEVRP